MATLNSIIVPWLIAEYGIDYADWDNQKTAKAMISHVIMTEHLGGYTERTFPAMIDGYRIQQMAFTKMILQ
jgi:lactate dehydrogenase-like 2-hydroxyacid dehydrogenase